METSSTCKLRRVGLEPSTFVRARPGACSLEAVWQSSDLERLKRILKDRFVGRFGRGSTGNDAQVCRWCPLFPHGRRLVNQCYQFIRQNGVLRLGTPFFSDRFDHPIGGKSAWGCTYGGVDSDEACAALPAEPRNGHAMRAAGDSLVKMCQYSWQKHLGVEGRTEVDPRLMLMTLEVKITRIRTEQRGSL